MSNTQLESLKIGKKLTCAGMGFDSDTLAEIVENNPKGETAIMNVLALISGLKVEPNKADPLKTSIRFSGQFEGTNLLTGETGRFAEAFFPGAAESYAAGLKGTSEGSVTLAFTVTVEKDNAKNSAQGYKFGMRALVNTSEEADPFKGLRHMLPVAKTAKPKEIAPPASGKKK